MRRLSAIAALLALPVMSVFSNAAADANAAVCAQTYGKSDGLACNYATYEQCRAAVSGLAGSCIDNPYLRAGSPSARSRKRDKR
jgi:Protein of unknown function (DUF3551)